MPTSATYTSFATQILDNLGANTSNWGADDGSSNTNPTSLPWSADVSMQFGSLNIPLSATIVGITIEIEGSGNPAANKPELKVTNGKNLSSGKDCNSSFSKGGGTVTYGGSTDLWGLPWDADTVNQQLQLFVDVSTIGGGGRIFWDYVKATINVTVPDDYEHDVIGVASSDISNVNGVPVANISNIIGV